MLAEWVVAMVRESNTKHSFTLRPTIDPPVLAGARGTALSFELLRRAANSELLQPFWISVSKPAKFHARVKVEVHSWVDSD